MNKLSLITVIILLILSSCFQPKKQLTDICGEETFDTNNELIYKVECDSLNGIKRIFNKTGDSEHLDLYLIEELHIEYEYKNKLNEKLEYNAKHNNLEVFKIVRTPGYMVIKDNEKVIGSPIIELSSSKSKGVTNKAFYIFTPSFSDFTTLSSYKLITEDSMIVSQKDYLLTNNKIILPLSDLELYDWKIEIKQRLNSGREYLFTKTISNNKLD